MLGCIYVVMQVCTFHRWIKSELEMHVFVLIKRFIFIWGGGASLQRWLAHFLLKRINGEIHRHKHFSNKKNIIISTFLIRLSFQWYSCKSGFVIFARMVTWNYTYNLFNKMAVKGLDWRINVLIIKMGDISTLHQFMVFIKVIMQGKLFHFLYCSVLSLGGKVNTRRMLQPDMESIFTKIIYKIFWS